MTKKFKLPKVVWASLMVVLLIGIYFAENIKGQIRFMQYCWKEGGLKVYEPLERNVGWWAEDLDSAKTISRRHPVDFVRFTDSEGKNIDVRYLGGKYREEDSYVVSPADHTKTVQYQGKFNIDKINGELRLSKRKYEIYRIKDNTLLAGYYVFGYSQFDPSNSFLGAPSQVHCPSASDIGFKSINETFK